MTEQFRNLMIFTYSGVIASIKDKNLQSRPLPADPDTINGVEAHSHVAQPRGRVNQLACGLEKSPTGWKVYDVNMLGTWLVETYKGNFTTEIKKGGIDDLIKVLGNKKQDTQ